MKRCQDDAHVRTADLGNEGAMEGLIARYKERVLETQGNVNSTVCRIQMYYLFHGVPCYSHVGSKAYIYAHWVVISVYYRFMLASYNKTN